eukprot:4975712-Prorocentrum_lima.AAC.1
MPAAGLRLNFVAAAWSTSLVFCFFLKTSMIVPPPLPLPFSSAASDPFVRPGVPPLASSGASKPAWDADLGMS